MFEIITGYIKQWKERRRRKSILKDIKKAKDIYLAYRHNFMCTCFLSVNNEKYLDSGEIQKRIPEFNREFLEAKTPDGAQHGGILMIENHVLKHLISL